MLKKLVAVMAMSLATAAYAQKWVDVSKTDNTLFSIQAGSLRYINTDGGKPAIVVVGRTTDLKKSQIEVVMWYVLVSDCLASRGKLVATDIDGKFMTDYSFVFGLGSSGAVIAETICVAGLDAAERREKTVPRNTI